MKIKLSIEASANHAEKSLTPGNVYRVIGIEADNFRLMNDYGEAALYPTNLFNIVDDRRPGNWVTSYGEEGEQYAYPAEMSRPGFFEDVWDGDYRAFRTVRFYLQQYDD